MAQNFLSQIYAKHGIRIDDAFQDSSGSPGLAGQLLLSTATGILWSDLLTVDETNGFFGINNTTPTAQLDVTGQVNFEDLKLDGELLDQFNSPGTNGMILQSLQLGAGNPQGINWVSAGQIVVTGIQENNNTAFIDVNAAGLGSGYVTGPVTITASLSASGTPTSTNFLSGDNTWKQIEIASGNTNTLTVAFTNKNVLTVQTPGVGAATLGLATGKQIYDYIAGLTVDDLSPPTADFDVNNNKILKVTTPTAPDDAANKAYVDNVVTGALVYQGGYNASTNTPDLTSSPNSIMQGWTYAVTVAGDASGFWSPSLNIGDLVIANLDNPTSISDWTEVQANIDVATAGTAAAAVIGIAGFNEDDFTAVNGFVSVKDDTYVPYTGATTDVDLGANNLIVDTNTLYVDSTNNRVGIGTASPDAKLKIEGAVSDNGLSIKSGGNTGINPFMVTWAGGTEGDAFCINDSLNVGIGTASPSTKLTITESGTSTGSTLSLIGTNTGGSASQVSQISSYQPSGGGAQDAALDFKVRSNVDPFASPSTIMTLLGSGNVGIGTESPSAKLEISNSSGNSFKSSSTTTTGFNASAFYNNNSKGWAQYVYGSAYSGGTYLNVGANGSVQAAINTTGAITTVGAFDLLLGTNSVERVRITSSGNVGIGAGSSPSEKLEVAGNVILDANNANIKIKSGVGGTKGDIQWLFNSTSTAFASIGIEYDNRNTDGLLLDSGYAITLDTSTYTRFSRLGTERMRITDAGGVSFGTSGTAHGTTGQILTSNGDATPTWGGVTYAGLGPEFTDTDAGTTSLTLNFSTDQIFTRTVGGTYTVSGAQPGMVKQLITTGGSAFSITNGKLIAGSYDGTVTNFIQIAVQTSTSFWYSISQE